jgi:hypothetical protein
MDAQEAWRVFKNDIKKECNIQHGFYTSHGRFIFIVCNNIPYEYRIKKETEALPLSALPAGICKLVSAARAKKGVVTGGNITAWKNKLQKYGTPENEARGVMSSIYHSEALKTLERNVDGTVHLSLLKENTSYGGFFYIKFWTANGVMSTAPWPAP